MNLEPIREAIVAAREHMKAVSSAALTQGLAAFFDEFPQAKTIYFAGYVPYFNDGDACEYQMTDVSISPRDYTEIDGPYAGDYYEQEDENEDLSDFNYTPWGKSDSRVTPEFAAAMKEISLFLNELDGELEQTYGSHCFIRLHRGGAEVSDYDHD